MCMVCNDLFDAAAGVLDEVLNARRADNDPTDTPGQRVVRTATIVLRSIESGELQANKDVQELCLALGAAAERLVALEQTGLLT